MVSCVAIVITVIGAVIAVAGGLVGYLVIPDIIDERVEESVKLVEGSDAFERWQNVPVPVLYKIYFFNVSNPDDVQNGSQPIVEEIGPYVYKQYRTKINIAAADDVLSYYQHQLYEFDEEASAPLTEYDDITVVNLPLMSIATVAEYNSGSTLLSQLTLLNSAISTIFQSPTSVFLTTTPRDFLFDGVYVYCNSTGIINSLVCNQIENYAPVTMPRLSDGRFKFSLLSHKNDTNDGYYSINSGLNDVSQLGEILAWENSSVLDTWGEDGTCNDIVGCDASLYPPFRTQGSSVNIFSTDICRSVRVDFSEVSSFSGIESYKYEVGKDMLSSPLTNPENQCFCLSRTQGIRGTDGCLLDGAMELWDCQGAPVVLSHPHFYLADESYQNGVDGLSPNRSLHEIFLELEPITGTLLRGSKRVQFNIFLRPISRISLTTNLPTTLMPIVWIDESIELTDELIDELNASLFDVLDLVNTILWGVIAGGAVLFVIGFVWMLISCCRSRSAPANKVGS
ncbi:sensory neuron membrane protein 2 isoform X1 [Neodiprion pinetum]|uniref:sensory neuron membrane protein 2 isoform X1 n=1 Tax=Neodiprion pinetum TaxID=441929 RepID=UPI001EDEA0E1|nr:sensory neuron membrane protein 2 isoform X1 [Neodiprion pinetum]